VPLNHTDHPNPRFGVGVDVSLRRSNIRVARQFLNVFQRPADGRYLSSGIRNERPSSAVAGAADEPEVSIPPLEHVYDGLRRSGQFAFGAEDVRSGAGLYLLPVLDLRLSNVVVEGNPATRLALTGM